MAIEIQVEHAVTGSSNHSLINCKPDTDISIQALLYPLGCTNKGCLLVYIPENEFDGGRKENTEYTTGTTTLATV